MPVDWTVFAVSLFAFWERSELFSLHKNISLRKELMTMSYWCQKWMVILCVLCQCGDQMGEREIVRGLGQEVAQY